VERRSPAPAGVEDGVVVVSGGEPPRRGKGKRDLFAEVVVEGRSEGRMELGFLAGAMESRRTVEVVVRLQVWVERKG